MALNTFGWTPAEVTTDSAGNAIAGAELTVWADIERTTPIQFAYDRDGTTVLPTKTVYAKGDTTTALTSAIVTSGAKGRFGFIAQDTYSLVYVWDGSSDDPWPVAAHEALDSGSATHAQAVADAQAAANSAAASAALVGAPAGSAMDTYMGGSAANLVPTVAGKIAKGALFVNVKDYGATGDGTTNDTTAIQNAINAGSIIYMPPGSYVASGLILTTGKTLFGAGRGATTIKHNVNNDCIAATGTSGTPLSGITVRDLTILGNNGSANQRGIYFQYTDDSTVQHVKISGCGNNGLNWYTSKRSKVLNCEVTAVLNFGILVYRCAEMLVQGCDVHHISTANANLGIQLKSSQSCQVIANRVNNITGYGIYTWDDGLDTANYPDADNIVSDNQVHDFTTGGAFAGTGIYINATKGARVASNTVNNCSGGSITVAAAVAAIVEGNRVNGSADAAGIGLSSGTKHSRVSSNIVSGYCQGIVIDACNFNRIEGNSVYNLGASASGLAAGIRIRNTSNNNSIAHNQCIDDQGTPTMKRGIYQESGNYNTFAFNLASGSTAGNYAVVGTNSVQVGNMATLTDNPLPVGDSTGKVGFFGATPVVKPTATPAAATDLATAQALVNDIRAKLIALGLIA